MSHRNLARLLLLVLIVGAAAAVLIRRPAAPPTVYLFPNLVGPAAPTPVTESREARPEDFGGGSDHRLAILVTDTTSGWLGLARGLRAHGIPFSMTRNVSEAVRHRVVFAYPTLSGKLLAAAAIDALRAHVDAGGALLAFDVEGGGLYDLFGIEGPPKASHAEELHWDARKGIVEEDVTRISRKASEAQLTSLRYPITTATRIARFEDGGTALACRKRIGTACVLGVDVGALAERSMNGREEAVARSYANGYEPSVDTLFKWIAGFYVAGEPMPWLVDTAPAGKQVTILLTHDVDFTGSVASAAASAKALAAAGANATFFMQTKYVKDYNDDVFFNKTTVPQVRSILASGLEVGSHSVAHSNAMKQFGLGSGTEQYPAYRPFVETRSRTRGASIMGELRVSRFLLQRLAGADVVSFRAGYLSNPFALPQALAASGYRYDSSITANSCLTHFPFQLTRDRADRSLEPVFEFPVTIEDEAAPSLVSRYAAASKVIGDIARTHGLAVVLVHPDVARRKLDFERKLVAEWRARAWFASMRQFGDWWRARDQADIDVDASGSGWTLRVNSALPLENLVVRLPKMAAAHVSLPPGLRRTADGIAVDAPGGTLSARF